jgi:ABC-type transport system involved in cytochrome c biogenesis permease subunit
VTGPLPLYLSLGCYLAAGIAAGVRRGRGLSAPSLVASLAGLVLQLGFVVFRTGAAGFLPFASRFESMSLFAFSVQAVGLLVWLATCQNSVKLGTDAAAVLLLVGALLPAGFHPGGGMNPILNSSWFAFHILVAFAGYACFTAGLVWSIASLFDRQTDSNPAALRRLALAGLVLLGTGIVTGAAWADSSWGTYWGWDPKESWALLTWSLVMAGLHLRVFGPSARRWPAVLGFGLVFATMMFTFIGINLLKWGLHRY